MASSIVHLAVTDELIKRHDFSDTNRLRFGSVIPDAGSKEASHLKVSIMDGRMKTYDLDRFRAMYGERMLTDDLYLGYYLHLVQDALYRHFVYDRYHWDPNPPGNIEKLHNDYSTVNFYVVKKYGLVNDLNVPNGFEQEDINRLCVFDVERFMSEIAAYFLPAAGEPIFFFTKEMSDEFIAEAAKYCSEEIRKLRNGDSGMDMTEYAWSRAGDLVVNHTQ